MELTKIEKNGVICAVVNSDELVITDTQTAHITPFFSIFVNSIF